MKPLLMLTVALTLTTAPATAQTEQGDNPRAATRPTEKCRAQTDSSKQKPADNTLSETLDNCGGVLNPPATGDQGMTTPPPAEGNTPVIKPGEVPAQPPKQ
ncbi:hypothetical protein LGH82_31185 [Mesorhizobium sp. PAMC28654]|nr:hypothetical protein LGH82_31185 [Mesorhizobium sp. PAMC28654]